jgi:hypothetical protein
MLCFDCSQSSCECGKCSTQAFGPRQLAGRRESMWLSLSASTTGEVSVRDTGDGRAGRGRGREGGDGPPAGASKPRGIRPNIFKLAAGMLESLVPGAVTQLAYQGLPGRTAVPEAASSLGEVRGPWRPSRRCRSATCGPQGGPRPACAQTCMLAAGISTASRSGWTGVASSQTHQDTGERVARKCGMRPKAGSAFRSSVPLLGE